jgi:hypothetical protein
VKDVATFVSMFTREKPPVWRPGTAKEMVTNQTAPLPERWGLGWMLGGAQFGPLVLRAHVWSLGLFGDRGLVRSRDSGHLRPADDQAGLQFAAGAAGARIGSGLRGRAVAHSGRESWGQPLAARTSQHAKRFRRGKRVALKPPFRPLLALLAALLLGLRTLALDSEIVPARRQ